MAGWVRKKTEISKVRKKDNKQKGDTRMGLSF